MTAFSKLPTFEAAAVEAVRIGRQLAETLPQVQLHVTAALADMLPQTLERFAAGEVFAKQDELPLQLMFEALRQTLDAISPGYGAFFANEPTSHRAFLHPEPEAVRSLGEVLKKFLQLREFVVNTIVAERQVVLLRRT